MANLQDLINLSKLDGGKFFVLDESGEVKLVILPIDDYQKLMEGKLVKKMKTVAEDVEKVNKEILRAQLQEPEVPVTAEIPKPRHSMPRVLQERTFAQQPDLREEVIDPSFDFEGPKVEIDDL